MSFWDWLFRREEKRPEIPPYRPPVKPPEKPQEPSIVVEEADVTRMSETGVHRAFRSRSMTDPGKGD